MFVSCRTGKEKHLSSALATDLFSQGSETRLSQWLRNQPWGVPYLKNGSFGLVLKVWDPKKKKKKKMFPKWGSWSILCLLQSAPFLYTVVPAAQLLGWKLMNAASHAHAKSTFLVQASAGGGLSQYGWSSTNAGRTTIHAAGAQLPPSDSWYSAIKQEKGCFHSCFCWPIQPGSIFFSSNVFAAWKGHRNSMTS